MAGSGTTTASARSWSVRSRFANIPGFNANSGFAIFAFTSAVRVCVSTCGAMK